MTAPAVLDPALSRPHTTVRLDPAALRRARKNAGLTLADVEAAIGRSASVVARHERGLIDPPASVLGQLAGLYRVEVGAFYTGGDR